MWLCVCKLENSPIAIGWKIMKIKIKKIKIPRKGRRKKVIEPEQLAVKKCLVFGDFGQDYLENMEKTSGSGDTSEDTQDTTLVVGDCKFVFWPAAERLKDQSKAFWKQYLAYHQCDIVLYIVNVELIEEKILELSSLIELNIIE